MAGKIRIGIYGYGNIGKSVERIVAKNTDMELAAVFTRRDPGKVVTLYKGTKVAAADKVLEYKDKVDVMLLCGGSATDLPDQGPRMAEHFNTVDSYDTHAKIPEYFKKMKNAAELNKKAAVISVGWDPGLFSMMKSLFMSVLPEGNTGAFWGPGVSQGHGEAIRRVKGVADAIQYTIPSENIMNEIRGGSQKEYTTKQKHKRLCYVVAENGADKESIAKAIMEMPYYFADYETEVNFITSEEMKKEHTGMPHAGHVIRSGITAADEGQMMEFLIRLDSNPAFTASIMVAYARAAFRLFIEKQYGARTVLDIPVSYLSPDSTEKQISDML